MTKQNHFFGHFTTLQRDTAVNVSVPVYVPPTSVLENGLPVDGSAGAVVLPVQTPT